MHDKDKEAFIEWYKNKESEFDNCKEAWRAACEYKQKKLDRKYTDDVTYLDSKILNLQAENKKLRDALEFYADPRWWDYMKDDLEEVIFDGGFKCKERGKRAREALKEVGEV
jgi:hypothetical protein